MPKQSILYDFVNDITFDKKYMFSEDNEKSYSPYMVNRVLSMFYDTAMYVFYVDKFKLSKRTHFEFLYYAIPKKKRYIKYIKGENIDDLKYITEYYQISNEKGMQYLKLMNKEQINIIKEKYKNIKL